MNLLEAVLLSIISFGVLLWIYNIIYSLFISPNRFIPGPLKYQIFPILVSIPFFIGDSHLVLLKLHKQYGPVVRLGWTMISFCSDESVKEIYSSYRMKKSLFYEGLQVIGETVFSTSDRRFHKQRKNIIAPCFNDAHIRSYESIVASNIKRALQKISNQIISDETINLNYLFQSLSFDIIGELCFNKPFYLIEKEHPILNWVDKFLVDSVVSIVIPFAGSASKVSSKRLYDFSYDAINRNNQDIDKNSLLYALKNSIDKDNGQRLTEKQVVEEIILLLIAGSDTTSNSITWLFYLLLTNPSYYNKLKTIIRETFPKESRIEYSKCLKIPFLTACINESMRLLPAAPGLPPRQVPSPGCTIDGYFIKAGTHVGVSIYSLHHNPEVWDQPDVFLPERWLTEGNQIKSYSSFYPFLMGPRGCIGRGLALMEIYLIVSNLLRDIDWIPLFKEVETTAHLVMKPKISLLAKGSLYNI